MTLKGLYEFREERFQHFSHSLKVFIFGVDISQWLKGGVSITYGNRDSYNSASFDLSNPNHLWQMTKENLDGQYRGSGAGEYSEEGKKSIFTFKNANNEDISLDIKENAFQDSSVRSKTGARVDDRGKVRFTAPKEGNEKRFRFAVNDCVFSKHDPIRIFAKNPLSNADEWMEVFCGFVQEHPITTNYLNGESSVRVSCYCIRQMLTKTRVQMNSLIHGNDPTPIFNSGFFTDFAKGGIGTTAFGASSLEETIKELILGTSQPSRTSDPLASQKSAKGVGQFKIGNVVCYDPAKPGNTLERWHLMTMFGVNKKAYPSASPDNDDLWLTKDEMDKIGLNTQWSPNKDVSGPDARYLHFLLPSGGTGAGALIQSTVDTQAKEAEWTTRWDIIRDYASKLDFQVLTSPSGDLLVEFPLYGFTPATFRRESPPGGTAFGGEAENSKVGLEPFLTFDIHQKEETLNDEAEDFPTVLQVNGGYALQNINTQHGNFRSFVYSPVLAARLGVIVEQCDYPFAGQTSSDTPEQVTKRLSKLGMIEYTKRMADASSWAGSVVYRPFLFPNRPVYLKRSARVGNLTSVTYNWNIGKDASCTIGMNQLMAERYDPDKKQSSFRLLTGAVNTPISYAAIWGSDDDAVRHAGTPSQGSSNPKDNQPKGPNPELPDTTGETKKNAAAPPPLVDLNYLYPPFKALVENLLQSQEFQATGGYVTETAQSKERAAFINSTSMTQFGLGVFIKLKDNNAFSTVQGINSSVNSPPMKVETFNKSTHEIEFVAPVSWMTYEIAKKIIKANNDGPEAYKHVWTVIDCNTQRKEKGKNYEIPASVSEADKAFVSESGDLADTTKPAPPCRPSTLQKKSGVFS